jgi:hypothetical protein
MRLYGGLNAKTAKAEIIDQSDQSIGFGLQAATAFVLSRDKR